MVNKVKKLYWNLWYPFKSEWVFFILFYGLFLTTGDISCAFISMCPFFLLKVRKGTVNEYFFYYKKNKVMFLCQNNKKLSCLSCAESMRKFSQSVKYTAEQLPNGGYEAITHITVIQRIKKSKAIIVTEQKQVYTDTLLSELSKITGKNCRKCTDRKNCKFANRPERDFYLIQFTKSEEVTLSEKVDNGV